jgi:hypothetical protein
MTSCLRIFLLEDLMHWFLTMPLHETPLDIVDRTVLYGMPFPVSV